MIYHVIFSTKNRENIINSDISEELYRYIGGIIKGEGGVLLEIGGTPDHIHVVIKLKPVNTLSYIMQKIKGHSSKWMNKEKRLKTKFEWQGGYGAFSVSESQIPKVGQYVREQEKHHQKLEFKEEFLIFLKQHNVEYNEKYIWI